MYAHIKALADNALAKRGIYITIAPSLALKLRARFYVFRRRRRAGGDFTYDQLRVTLTSQGLRIGPSPTDQAAITATEDVYASPS